MKHLFTIALLAGAAFAATPALAQDNDDWSGFYVGGQLGYGFRTGGSNETILFDTNLDGVYGDTVNTSAPANAFSPGFCDEAANGPTPADGCDGDRNGIEGGIHAGFDVQTGGGFVIGGVVDYTRTRLRDSVSAFSTTPARYTMTRRLRDVMTIRARAGFASGPTLFYATGGLAYGNIRNSFSTSNTANSFTDNGNEHGWGYVFGGGVERKLGSNFSVGLQYLYRSVDAGDYVVRAGPGTAPLTNPFRIVNPNGTDFSRSRDNFTSHGIQMTASYRF
ncbi:MAG TPA: outer membrane beta-barrel protein [Allosphingosinicella sp.]|nr:outer membrane beta-barrel protein [Allosphingosinicella sp.]